MLTTYLKIESTSNVGGGGHMKTSENGEILDAFKCLIEKSEQTSS